MRIVFDTNCLIQCISPYSKYRVVWESILSGKNTLCVSNEILEEYAEILQRLFGFDLAEIVVKTIINNPYVELVTPYYKFRLIEADPDDNKFVDCAIAANAKYIVTNDHHYNILRSIPFPVVETLSLADFSKICTK